MGTCRFNHFTIIRNVARRLRQAASSPALEQHVMKKNGWNDWMFNSVEWDSQGKALGMLEHNQETFVIKWAHNLLATRKHMKRLDSSVVPHSQTPRWLA
jgi:hypothetical protein